MNKKLVLAGLLSSLMSSLLTPQNASAFMGETRSLGAAIAPYIEVRGATLAPFSYIRFCLQNPDDCRASTGTTMVSLDAAKRAELMTVNRAVNRKIRPVNDKKGATGDVWQADVTAGDCEDFALTKRRALVAAGWPEASLRLAVALTRSGEGHAVLIVKTSEGDLVLDNRMATIRPWNKSDLRLLKIQSGTNPRLWFNV